MSTMTRASEKDAPVAAPKFRMPSASATWIRMTLILGAGCLLFRYYIIDIIPQWSPQGSKTAGSQCPQVEPLVLKTSDGLDRMDDYLQSDAFRNRSIARLSGAVQVPTQSYDDLGAVGEDPRWDIFYSFAGYLTKTFPLTHSILQLEKVNTHALLYTWPGADPTLKPTVLMAHQDVVPVPQSTVAQWTHPPFSGYYDGKFVWGRGASDCKNQLIGILEAVEALLEADFVPQRTLVLSFGFDEEVSGPEGAGHLSQFLLKRYGHHGAAVIVDEGAVNVESWGTTFAVPGVAEKGAVDVDITIRMPGGHSSIPPKHNGIGVASELITLIEEYDYQPVLHEENPYLAWLYCGAEHAPEFPEKLKHLLHQRSRHSSTCARKRKEDKLAIEAARAGPEIKYLFTTSVAVDLINGGVKTNALPERTQFTVNHRTNVGSTSKAVLDHISSLAGQVAKKHNLALIAFNGTESQSSITLSARDTLLEPAPITPTSISRDGTTPFAILAGTTRALYGKDLIVAPGLMTGNTDTRYYWDVSEHIFRYGPGWDKEQEGMGNIHTVDERIGVQGHIDTVRWMTAFIRGMDAAQLA